MVRPVLRRLVETTGESASFFARQGEVRLCLFREEPQHAVREHVMESATLTLDRGAARHMLVGYDSRTVAAEEFRSRMVRLPIVSASAMPRSRPSRCRSIGAALMEQGRLLSRQLGADEAWRL